MHLKLTPKALLTQLGYATTNSTLKQMQKILDSTENMDRFLPHLLSFKDALEVEKGFIAMSNTQDRLKIKCESDINAKNLDAFHKIVERWSNKYALRVQRVNENTYYLNGVK